MKRTPANSNGATICTSRYSRPVAPDMWMKRVVNELTDAIEKKSDILYKFYEYVAPNFIYKEYQALVIRHLSAHDQTAGDRSLKACAPEGS